MDRDDTLHEVSLRPRTEMQFIKGDDRKAERLARQGGGIAIMFALLLIPILGICGLAIDLGIIYYRQGEMRNVADAIALSAAGRLNGTPAGIDDAIAAASATATAFKYDNHSTSLEWSSSALSFSASPARSGTWSDAASARTTPERVYYVRVDTSRLSGAGNVSTILMSVVSSTFANILVSGDIIAGRTGIDVAPLAICAMSATPAAPRTNSASYVELVEYGFRRGIAYDLMNLNPAGTTPANFVLDPLATPGTPASAINFQPATLGRFVCSGRLGVARVTGDAIAIRTPFPLASVVKQLNTRFDQYDSDTCSASGAQPDFNIKPYDFTKMPSVFPWMNTAPAGQTAASVINNGKLQTVADVTPPTGNAGQYGPLWSYAKAVPYSAYSAGTLEPAAGYATFSTASWPTLYAGQTAKTYPTGSATPYKPGAGVNLGTPAAAHAPGLRNRRVLNVPLLSCPSVPSSSATVLAIGKFFMTVPATDTSIPAEFGGILPLERVSRSVGIFP